MSQISSQYLRFYGITQKTTTNREMLFSLCFSVSSLGTNFADTGPISKLELNDWT
jgi:hypothetical protein